MASFGERARSAKSLVCLLQGVQGRHTTLELRNEITVVGKIASVDDRMKLVACSHYD